MPASYLCGSMINGQTDPRPTSAGPGAVIAANAAPTRDRTEADTEVVGTRGLTLDLGHADSGHGRGSEMIRDHGPQELHGGVPPPGC